MRLRNIFEICLGFILIMLNKMNEYDYEVVVIGAGVIGLSVAYSLSKTGINSVLVIEKEDSFGRKTSSRNSEVIHSGIYYPEDSLKTKHCLQGRKLLYDFCIENDVWFNKCGKLITCQKGQEKELLELYKNSKKNKIKDIKIINRAEVQKIEPFISSEMALLIKCTGIVSSHTLMERLFNSSKNADHDFLFKTEFLEAEKLDRGYKIFLNNSINTIESLKTKWVVNAAGLQSDLVSKKIDDEIKAPRLTFSKGNYFKLKPKWRNCFKHLVYPLPDKINNTLGIHLTIDQNGDAKLGPDAFLMNNKTEDYSVEERLIDKFYDEARRYIIGLKKSDMTPDYSGIRPKIMSKNKVSSDFYISNEIKYGHKGLINLIGIESPGLTSALSIGREVKNLILKS